MGTTFVDQWQKRRFEIQRRFRVDPDFQPAEVWLNLALSFESDAAYSRERGRPERAAEYDLMAEGAIQAAIYREERERAIGF